MGNIPYGFELLGDKLIPNEEEIEVVKEMKAVRATGHSYQKIADNLNARGIVPKNGGRFWYNSSVNKVVNNSIYGQLLV